MPQTVDRMDFACADVDPGQWPKLSCGGSNLLDLAASSLRLEVDRALLFQDNGQIRSFDDNHKIVFDRASGLLELHEAGAIRFLTGTPTPSERLRIQTDGNVGIGTDAPSTKLHVAGALRTEGDLHVNGGSVVEGSLQVTVGINVLGSAQVQGDLQVNGLVNASDIRLNNAPLRLSQWEDSAGSINYAGGNVGIGVVSPTQALEVNGTVKATGFIMGSTPVVSSQWTSVGGGVNYAVGKVGIGMATPSEMLHVAGHVRINDNNLWLRGGSDPNHGIGWYGPGKLFANTSVDGPAIFGCSGGALGTACGGQKIALYWNNNSNIGIGTTTPQAKLHVEAGSLFVNGENTGVIVDEGGQKRVGFMKYLRREAGIWRLNSQDFEIGRLDASVTALPGAPTTFTTDLYIAGNGNVGIGTVTPDAPLHVANYMAVGPFGATTGQGGIDVSGPAAELGFVKRTLTSWPATPAAGDRFVWYNPDGSARLWTERSGDLLTVTNDGNLGFGARTRQMLNLWSTGYGIGVQAWTQYFRTDKNFAWYKRGTHNDNELNPGGGVAQMVINDGNVGIGTTTPGFRLDVADRMRVRQGGSGTAGIWLHQAAPNNDRAFVGMANDNGVGLWGNTGAGWGLIMNTGNGDVTISGHLGTLGWPATPRTPGWSGGIHTWDVEAEGTMWSRGGYQSGNRDLAENYASTMRLEPGDVVCLDPSADQVVLATQAHDMGVIGVISTAPGVLLNENHDPEAGKQFPVALCGRIPCKVVAENGPIQRGDLLTSSSTPGHAMKAQPIVVDGHTFHRPGTIIGKALEAHPSGEGVIEIFVATR